MPKVRVQVPHQLEQQAAINRLREYSRQMQIDFAGQVSHMEEIWSENGVVDFSFRVLGFSVSGKTVVESAYAEVMLHLPFAAIPFRGMIEREIATRLESALAADIA